jgi:hypothetical protein
MKGKIHRHHKIPKHAGGTDDPSNIEMLTIEEHAEAHRKLFEKYGRWQDKKAWLFLSGRVNADEAWYDVMIEGKRQLMNDGVRWNNVKKKAAAGLKRAYENGHKPWNAGKTGLKQISENVKKQAKEGNFHCIGDYQRGRKFDDEHKKKLSERAKQRKPVQCQFCGKTTSPAMNARWHGNKCKVKDIMSGATRRRN